MNAKVIAVANMKGGVGKTATVVSLAEALAASGYEVLVIDLDPQANASVCLAGDPMLAELMKEGQTIEALLKDQLIGRRQKSINECVRGNVSTVTHKGKQLSVSLLPSSPELRNFEFHLIRTLTDKGFSWSKLVGALENTLQKQLKMSRRNFDFILIDCAPGISALTEVSVRLADLILVPTIPDFLSTYGLQAFCATLQSRGLTERLTMMPRTPHVLVTRRRPTTMHRDTIVRLQNEALAPHPAFRLFDTIIPEAASISTALGQAESKDMNQPISFPTFASKWKDDVIVLLNNLVDEIRRVLNVHRA